jgi:hypothetical protein
MTWPGQTANEAATGQRSRRKRLIDAVDFDNDGQSLYFAVLSAPVLAQGNAGSLVSGEGGNN